MSCTRLLEVGVCVVVGVGVGAAMCKHSPSLLTTPACLLCDSLGNKRRFSLSDD